MPSFGNLQVQTSISLKKGSFVAMKDGSPILVGTFGREDCIIPVETDILLVSPDDYKVISKAVNENGKRK